MLSLPTLERARLQIETTEAMDQPLLLAHAYKRNGCHADIVGNRQFKTGAGLQSGKNANVPNEIVTR
jgi:hypothetical protein